MELYSEFSDDKYSLPSFLSFYKELVSLLYNITIFLNFSLRNSLLCILGFRKFRSIFEYCALFCSLRSNFCSNVFYFTNTKSENLMFKDVLFHYCSWIYFHRRANRLQVVKCVSHFLFRGRFVVGDFLMSKIQECLLGLFQLSLFSKAYVNRSTTSLYCSSSSFKC